MANHESHPAFGTHAASPDSAAARRSYWHRAFVRPAKALALLLYALAYMCYFTVVLTIAVFASAGGLDPRDIKIDQYKHLRAWWDRFGPNAVPGD